MARRSKLLQVLRLAEDFLISYNRYFEKKPWVYIHSGLSPEKRRSGKRYLQKIGKLDNNLSLDLSEKSVYHLISKPWDGKWRFVCFDIPEKHKDVRDQIRRSVKNLGFRQLQRSIWISPLSVDSYIDKIRKKLDEPLIISFIVGEMKGVTPGEAVNQLWDLNKWQDRCHQLIKRLRTKKSLNSQIETDFWSLVAGHPKVPVELLPNDWPLNKLITIFVSQAGGNG